MTNSVINGTQAPKRRKANEISNWLLFLGTPVVLAAIWQFLCNNGTLNPSVMPSPSRVGETFLSMLSDGSILFQLGVSLQRVLLGFLFGSLAGMAAGFLMGFFEKVNKAAAVLLGILRPIPMIGLVPLFILWFGIGEKSKIILIAVGTFWSVWLNTEHGICSTDGKYLEIGKVLEKNRLTVLARIIFPASLPSVITGLRLGLSAAWHCVVAAEMIAATSGVGFMISNAGNLQQPDVMFVGLLTIGLVGLAIDILILKVQDRLIYWE